MEALEKYNVVKTFVAMLIGDYGKAALTQHPQLKLAADKAIEALRVQAMGQSMARHPDTETMFKTLDELRVLKSAIPEASYETRKEIKDQEAKLVEQLQTILDYDPFMYHDIYFLTIGSTQNYVNNTELIVNTQKHKNFYLWFKGSQVVTQDGEPLIVYHGTGGGDEFTKFNFKMFPAAYFAENKTYSDWFANIKKQKATVYQCYLRIVNPIDLTTFGVEKVTYQDLTAYIQLRYGYTLPENKMLKAASDKNGGLWAWQYLRGGVDWLKYLKQQGEFDGLKFYENNPSDIDPATGKENITVAWMVFRANQIKAAHGNSIYNLQSEDIRMKKGGTLWL